MTTAAGEVNNYPMLAGRRRRIELEMEVAIGAAGAATITRQDDPGMSCTHGATGVYALTFPGIPAGQGASAAELGGILDLMLVSAALTVNGFTITAFNPQAGTASVTINKNGTATDPANGDVVTFQLFLRTEVG